MLDTETNHLEIGSAKAMVDDYLRQFFGTKIGMSRPIGDSYVRLWQTMEQLSLAGGKRLRPYMVMVSYQAFQGANPTSILPVATAWELLHLCMLIHDDIIDNDTVRYGIRNISGMYDGFYTSDEPDPVRRMHLANSAAILAGDLAHSGAHEIIIKSSLPAEQKILAQQFLASATFSVAGGELLDTESVLDEIGRVDALSIARFKTASYSFVGPLSTGAALAGASERQLELLERFGTALGCGFQLADDLLGIFGDEAKTGKSTIGDIREGKRTYMMQYAHQHASAKDRNLLDGLLGKQDVTPQEADTVRDIVVRTGARQAAEAAIAQFETTCMEVLQTLAADRIDTHSLQKLVGQSIKRVR